jgi:Tol biopolymer transport system component
VTIRWAAVPLLALALAAGASGDPMKLQGRIAFSAGPLEPGRSNVYVYDFGTGKTTRVTRGRGVEFDPTLSPAGTRVAWRSVRNGNEEIRVADVDGSHVRNLTRHPAVDYAPAWSPDGRKLAFASTRASRGGLPHIWIVNADGSNPHVLTRAFTGEYPAWSPDGRQIVFTTNQPVRQDGFDLVVADADGRNAHRLTRNDLYEMGPAWSPTGDAIAFHAGNNGYHDLYLMQPDGSDRRQIVSSAEMPSWSPDGRHIVYGGPSGLVVIDRDGNDAGRVLTDIAGGNFPWWARSGR